MVLDFKKKLLVAGLGKTLATADGVPDVLASLDLGELKSLLDEARQLVNEGVVSYCRMTFAKGRPKAKDRSKNAAATTPQLETIGSNAEDCGPGCNC